VAKKKLRLLKKIKKVQDKKYMKKRSVS